MEQSTSNSSEGGSVSAEDQQRSPSVSLVTSDEPGQTLSDPADEPANTPPGHADTTAPAHTPCNGSIVSEGPTPATEPFCGERAMWNPFWYRKQTLVLYASLFLLLAVAILVLHFVSVRNNGLASQSQTSETIFFWKYLPTAVLVAIVALWTPLDYTARLLQPWLNLKKGPASPDRTLFLDLISPWQPFVLYRVTKHSEWIDMLTTSCAFLLEILKIISTGLLTIEVTQLSIDHVPMVMTASIDGNLFDPHQNTTASSLYGGIRTANLTYPKWTSDFTAFQPFELGNDSSDGTFSAYSAVTTAFLPRMDCREVIQIGQPEYIESLDGQIKIDLQTDDCVLSIQTRLGDSTQASTMNLVGHWPKKNFAGLVYPTQCKGEGVFLFVVTQADGDLHLTNMSSALCKPEHELQDVLVHVDVGSENVTIESNSTTDSVRTMEGFDNNRLFSYIIDNTNTDSTVTQPPGTTVSNIPFLRTVSLPITSTNTEIPYLEPLLDVGTLIESIQSAYCGISTLVVSEQMMRPDIQNITGTAYNVQQRLLVNLVSTVTIVVLLATCTAIALGVLFFRSNDIVPRNPNSIGGIALLLNSSPELKAVFEHNFRKLPEILGDEKFVSANSTSGELEGGHNPLPRFSIRAESGQLSWPAPDPPGPSGKASEKALWQPLTLEVWVRVLSLVIPLALIASLEVLQRRSDRLHGILEISSPGTAHYWVAYIPALFMVGYAGLYGSIHFNTVLLAPYEKLYEKPETAKSTIQCNVLGQAPLFALLPCMRMKQSAAIFSGTGVVLGAFLTVAVSGLYMIVPQVSTREVVVTQRSQFTTTWNGTAFDDGYAGRTMSLLTWQNLSDPVWTYQDLALPQLSIAQGDLDQFSDVASVRATVPARRAVLDCEEIPPERVVVDTSGIIYSEVKNTCTGGSDNPLPLIISGSGSATLRAGMRYLTFSSIGDGSVQAWADSSIHPPTTKEDGCPSLCFYFGTAPSTPINSTSFRSTSTNITFPEAEITVLSCKQLIQELDTAITLLTLPDLTFTLDDSTPPLADNHTAHYVSDGASADGTNVHPYQFMWPIGDFFTILTGGASAAPPDLYDLRYTLGGFYTALLYGPDGIPSAELVGTANTHRLASATSTMYGRYMAQVMSSKMRVVDQAADGVPGPGQRLLRGTLEGSRMRLVQNRTAKGVLQGLLGTMAVLGAAAWVVGSWRRRAGGGRFSPHDPCSIAGVACLLAGSGLWKGGQEVEGRTRSAGGTGLEGSTEEGREEDVAMLLPNAAEWMDDAELERAGIWDGFLFSLREWQDGRFRIGVTRVPLSEA